MVVNCPERSISQCISTTAHYHYEKAATTWLAQYSYANPSAWGPLWCAPHAPVQVANLSVTEYFPISTLHFCPDASLYGVQFCIMSASFLIQNVMDARNDWEVRIICVSGCAYKSMLCEIFKIVYLSYCRLIPDGHVLQRSSSTLRLRGESVVVRHSAERYLIACFHFG